ncbi:MAG: hypothetical protein KIT89_05360 [Microcella sp.]|uniref:hypothetical protein n=1 Tax=Microcella sp. TaxID=1913979 RepID=UPI0024CD8605|nr:hypothetical protein [Microcella sp.]UYN84602.1 MAG: hypothetical protein KIT89_05360 [Microcella sp.]
MLTTLASVILASEEELAPLVAPAEVIAGVAALVFIMMGLVTFAYRDVANRHSHKKSSGNSAGH